MYQLEGLETEWVLLAVSVTIYVTVSVTVAVSFTVTATVIAVIRGQGRRDHQI